MNQGTVALLVLVATVVGGCREDPSFLPEPVNDGTPTARAFVEAIQEYPYEASPERAARIVAGLAEAKLCMSKAEIRSLLGQPDYGRLMSGPKGPNQEWLGTSWTYYLSKRDTTTNLNDPSVHVFFDTADRAHWIATNIEGAGGRGAVDAGCT